MGRRRARPCPGSLALTWSALAHAVAGNSLVGPGAVGSYQGPTHGRRHGGFVRVSEPSVAFFVAGSSIRAMNGLYARVDPASLEKVPEWRRHHLAYIHDYTGWIMTLAGTPAGSERATEWLFVDNDGVDRFIGPGESIIPPAGPGFHHAHRASSADSPGGAAKPDPAAGTAVAAAVEDDPEELPWQIVGIGSEDMLQRLRHYFRHYRHVVQEAIAGSGLPPMPAASGAAQEAVAPPSDWRPPPLLEGEGTEDICDEQRRDDVKETLGQCLAAGDEWCQAMVFVSIARCLRRQRKLKEAEGSITTALELRPRCKDAYLEQGLARLDDERYSEALASFQLLLRLDRDHPSVLDWLVRAHAHLRRQEEKLQSRRADRWLEAGATAHCVAWRQTGGCDPQGRREPEQDRPCDSTVPGDASGFCECRGRVAQGAGTGPAIAGESHCGHAPFSCAVLCRERWPEGAPEAEAEARDADKTPCETVAPPSWCSRSHYAVLEVPCDLQAADASTGAESEELKRAYKRRSLQVHPDRPGGHTDAFRRVAEAHAALADNERRRAFDDGEDLERGVEKDGTQSPPHRQVIEKKYFPERFDFEPFGDPHADRKERQAHEQRRLERRRQEELALQAAKAQALGGGSREEL